MSDIKKSEEYLLTSICEFVEALSTEDWPSRKADLLASVTANLIVYIGLNDVIDEVDTLVEGKMVALAYEFADAQPQ